jgi:hypothetical protein
MRNDTSSELSKTFSDGREVSATPLSKSAMRREFLRKVAALLGRTLDSPDPEDLR